MKRTLGNLEIVQKHSGNPVASNKTERKGKVETKERNREQY